MPKFPMKTACLALASLVLLSGCGAFKDAKLDPNVGQVASGREAAKQGDGSSILDMFRDSHDGVKVNRYLWTASLQVLDFLPIEAADPFTGVIATGYGTPPGGGQAYRATILISDPALDARSLNVAMQTRRGPVSAETQRAVEDAILGRARQLRIQAANY